jgi:hypothetical protein
LVYLDAVQLMFEVTIEQEFVTIRNIFALVKKNPKKPVIF